MASNLSDLIDRAMDLSNDRDKNAAITPASEEFIARHGQKRLVELTGELEWDATFDYKSERTRE